MLAKQKSNTIAKNSFKMRVLPRTNKRSYVTNKLEYRHDTNIFELLT